MPPFTNIPFPNVPALPGVPQLLRPPGFDITPPSSTINFPSLPTDADIQPDAPQAVPAAYPATWGIFGPLPDSTTALGLQPQGDDTTPNMDSGQAGTGASIPASISVISVEPVRDTRLADFPLQNGSFAMYNRVQLPRTVKITLALDGNDNDRSYFLDQIEAACLSTNLYSIFTANYTFTSSPGVAGYALESYSYERKATRGSTLLTVAITCKEVRQVSPATSTTSSPIVSPQDPASTPAVNGGIQQPAAPTQSQASGINTSVVNFIGAPSY